MYNCGRLTLANATTRYKHYCFDFRRKLTAELGYLYAHGHNAVVHLFLWHRPYCDEAKAAHNHRFLCLMLCGPSLIRCRWNDVYFQDASHNGTTWARRHATTAIIGSCAAKHRPLRKHHSCVRNSTNNVFKSHFLISHVGTWSQNFCHNVGNKRLSKLNLYAVALNFNHQRKIIPRPSSLLHKHY